MHRQKKNLVIFLALRHIRRRLLQSILTMLGVMIGVAALIIALSLTNGFVDELISSTLKATPHITLNSFDASPLPYDAALQADLAALPEVTTVTPFFEVQALMARRADSSRNISGRQSGVQIIGLEPQGAQDIFDLAVLQEQQAALEQGTSIILGASLAQTLGVIVGDKVFVRTLNGKSEYFEVVGTFRVNNELIDSVVAYTNLRTVQAFLHADDAITGFYLRTKNPQQASTLSNEAMRRSGLVATSWDKLFGLLIEQLQLQKALIAVVIFLIVLVAASGIANILVLTVSEKTEEIAILRALGASRAAIIQLFTLEALILGGGGTLLGMILGLLAALYLKFQPIALPGSLYFITRLPMELQWLDLFWVCTISLLISVVAGVLPARRASSLDPAQILR